MSWTGVGALFVCIVVGLVGQIAYYKHVKNADVFVGFGIAAGWIILGNIVGRCV